MRTWIGRASMSARRANQGCAPEPMEATMPVLATGHVYWTPSQSSSDLMSWLVLTSSKASSGYSWILLRTPLNHSKKLPSFADPNSSWVSSLSSDSALSLSFTAIVIAIVVTHSNTVNIVLNLNIAQYLLITKTQKVAKIHTYSALSK